MPPSPEFPEGAEFNNKLHATPVSGIARLQRGQEALTVTLFFVAVQLLVGLVAVAGHAIGNDG